MSGHDPLTLAAAALRDAGEAAPADVAATRARVLAQAAAARGGAKKRAVVRWLVPIAAVLAVSTAWAGTRGALPEAWRRVAQLFAGHGEHDAMTTGASPAAAARAPAAVDRSASPAPVDLPEEEVPVVAVSDLPRVDARNPDAPAAVKRGSWVAPTSGGARASRGSALAAEGDRPEADEPSVAADSRDASADAELALYASAHRAHFVDHDPQAALVAWDAYLAAEPGGRFAPEARYNRAIALVRLGRRAEAREALLPFAREAPGGYRGAEAREVLRALERAGTSPPAGR